MCLQAEILGSALAGRGDEIAADAALRHQIESGDQPRQQIGRIEAGRDGRHDAEMRRRLGEQRHQRQRIVLRRPQGPGEIELHRAAVAVRHEQRILEQQIVEVGALQRSGHVDVEVGLGPVVAVRAGPCLVPAVHPVAVAQEPTEMKGTGCQRTLLHHEPTGAMQSVDHSAASWRGACNDLAIACIYILCIYIHLCSRDHEPPDRCAPMPGRPSLPAPAGTLGSWHDVSPSFSKTVWPMRVFPLPSSA